MIEDNTSAAVEDRISNLPNELTNRILELLPVHDAARTSILSKKWRYRWAMLPTLLLDYRFRIEIAKKSLSVFNETVDKILLQHLGDIEKFVLLGISEELSSLTQWILYVTRNGVKELTLDLPYKYKVPYIFNCPTLTKLVLHKCVLKPPNTYLGFQNLKALWLKNVEFVPTTEFCVINAPLLVKLTLIDCRGEQYLNIVSSQLEYLFVDRCQNLNLKCFMDCKSLRILHLPGVDRTHDGKVTLETLLFRWVATLETLRLDIYLLTADTVQKEFPFTLNCLCHLTLAVDFGELRETYCAIQLIKSCPNMRKLHISRKLHYSVLGTRNSEAVSKYLETPTCLDRPLNKLENVVIDCFDGSKVELLFVKLLCACTPSLVKMCIEPHSDTSLRKERNIAIKLLRFARASTRAELFYFPEYD